MNIRKLKNEDAFGMYEWMENKEVTTYLHGDYSKVTVDDAKTFIAFSGTNGEIHRAIENDEGEYMGTASLRHIDRKIGLAEFAVVVRKKAMGKGYAWFGMTEMLKYAFDKLGLERVYWRVSKKIVGQSVFLKNMVLISWIMIYLKR